MRENGQENHGETEKDGGYEHGDSQIGSPIESRQNVDFTRQKAGSRKTTRNRVELDLVPSPINSIMENQ